MTKNNNSATVNRIMMFLKVESINIYEMKD